MGASKHGKVKKGKSAKKAAPRTTAIPGKVKRRLFLRSGALRVTRPVIEKVDSFVEDTLDRIMATALRSAVLDARSTIMLRDLKRALKIHRINVWSIHQFAIDARGGVRAVINELPGSHRPDKTLNYDWVLAKLKAIASDKSALCILVFEPDELVTKVLGHRIRAKYPRLSMEYTVLKTGEKAQEAVYRILKRDVAPLPRSRTESRSASPSPVLRRKSRVLDK